MQYLKEGLVDKHMNSALPESVDLKHISKVAWTKFDWSWWTQQAQSHQGSLQVHSGT